ncbi:TetR/AcrR family transcriptional regulator [Streptosporangium sp. NPDC000396]|uniref:TetR/AcrR family transcriptional regulator n=1 Tax=Streptosporangium sp. NPDC000396 TaxID=3366185 RepID=UPI0036A6DB2D
MATTQKDADAGAPARGPLPGSSARGRRRADAERSIATIIDAAVTAFSENPEVSMVDIARVAGVGRVTLYSHFSSREELMDAVMAHAVRETNAVLDGEASEETPTRQALGSLIRSSWQVLSRYGRLQEAALRVLGPERMREHHDEPLIRIRNMIDRGRREGTIRDDLPEDWLVSVFYSLLHTAALEVDSGRLRPEAAPDVLEATLLSAIGA